MSIKVKEVLELAQSKGCTLAAGEGGMDRIVRFVDCMEIPDMKAWMRPNVLYITTGYAYSDTKEEIMNLIRNLYEAKAAALATKYRYIGCFLDDAIKLANELQFPIILWPEDLPFIEMNYLVMEALIKSQNNLMDTIYSRIEKYNRREMDKRLFIDLLTGNITCNEEGNYRIEEQKWPSPPYQIVYIEIDGIKQKLHELQEEIVHEKIEKIASIYNLSTEEIIKINHHIKDWNNLIPGTKLRLPEIPEIVQTELDNTEPFIEEYYPKLEATDYIKPVSEPHLNDEIVVNVLEKILECLFE